VALRRKLSRPRNPIPPVGAGVSAVAIVVVRSGFGFGLGPGLRRSGGEGMVGGTSGCARPYILRGGRPRTARSRYRRC
jgi:hypothetical protein